MGNGQWMPVQGSCKKLSTLSPSQDGLVIQYILVELFSCCSSRSQTSLWMLCWWSADDSWWSAESWLWKPSVSRESPFPTWLENLCFLLVFLSALCIVFVFVYVMMTMTQKISQKKYFFCVFLIGLMGVLYLISLNPVKANVELKIQVHLLSYFNKIRLLTSPRLKYHRFVWPSRMFDQWSKWSMTILIAQPITFRLVVIAMKSSASQMTSALRRHKRSGIIDSTLNGLHDIPLTSPPPLHDSPKNTQLSSWGCNQPT